MPIDWVISSFTSKFPFIQTLDSKVPQYLKILQRNSTLCFHTRETEFGACLEEVQNASSFDFKDRFECTCMQKLASIHSKILLVVKVRLSAHQNRCKEHRQGYNQFEMLRYHDFEHFGDTSLVNLARGKFLSHSDLLSSTTALVIQYILYCRLKRQIAFST